MSEELYTNNTMKLFIIDALGPFIFQDNIPHNWSKVPFEFYEKVGLHNYKSKIKKQFSTFIKRIKKEGFTAISIDDLAHMVNLAIYSENKKRIVSEWINLYKELFDIAQKHNIAIYVNTDIMFFSKETHNFAHNSDKNTLLILKHVLIKLFEDYSISGVISRIGEADGVDVKSTFRSKITIKKIAQARRYLKTLLPIFEKYNKTWIFRTWTIGIGEIGDLMWNTKTAKKMLKGISNDSLILSIKYGNADFFRNLELSNLFKLKGIKKIIELQAKREYDSFGELPYYTGFEYEKYYQQVKHDPEVIGILLWCQTGGWIKTNRVTFLQNSSPFVELNAISTINIFKGKNPKQEINTFFKNTSALNFIQKYNELSNKIMYPEKASTKYFKKIYIPPLVWVFWNNITINSFMSTVIKVIYKKPPVVHIFEFEELKELGNKSNFENTEFYIQTLEILYKARMTLHGKYSAKTFEEEITRYNQKYSFFTVSIDDKKYSRLLWIVLRLALRKNHKYNMFNTIMFNKFMTTLFYRLFLSRSAKKSSFANKQGMNIEQLIR